VKKNYLQWHKTSINKTNRELLNGHKSILLWLTGLSGAGKSTIANALEVKLHQKKIRTYLLDGDNIRHGINKDLGFSLQDRKENIRRIGEIGKLFIDAGIVVLVAAISPFRKDRNFVRNLLGNDEFIEIYIKCPIEVCEQRDPKGLYKKAKSGQIKDFTGINQPYEEPMNPEITIDTSIITVEKAVEMIETFLQSRLTH
jgi:adenylylsulfate kinase